MQDSQNNTHASRLSSPPSGHSRQERKNLSLRRNSPSSFGCATRSRATLALRTSPEKAIAPRCRSAYSPRWFCDRNNVRPQPTPQGRVSSPHPESEDVSRWHLNPDSDGCTLALVLRRRVQTRYLLPSSVSRRGVGSQGPSSTTMISFPSGRSTACTFRKISAIALSSL